MVLAMDKNNVIQSNKDVLNNVKHYLNMNELNFSKILFAKKNNNLK